MIYKRKRYLGNINTLEGHDTQNENTKTRHNRQAREPEARPSSHCASAIQIGSTESGTVGSTVALITGVTLALVAVITLLWQLGVIKAREDRPPETRIELSRNSGPVGTLVRVSGTGFIEEETVTLYVQTVEVRRIKADGSGEFSGARINIPRELANIPLPQFFVLATGLTSERVAQAPFKVTGGADAGGDGLGEGGFGGEGGGGEPGDEPGDPGDGSGEIADAPVIRTVSCKPDGENQDNIEVKPGDRVRWENDGEENFEFDMGNPNLSDPSEPIEPGKYYEFSFETPGQYGYTCVFESEKHSGMVIVKE